MIAYTSEPPAIFGSLGMNLGGWAVFGAVLTWCLYSWVALAREFFRSTPLVTFVAEQLLA